MSRERIDALFMLFMGYVLGILSIPLINYYLLGLWWGIKMASIRTEDSFWDKETQQWVYLTDKQKEENKKVE